MTTKLKQHDKKIREIIEKQYSGSTYEYKSLPKVIDDISSEIKKEFTVENESMLKTSIVHFIYYSDNDNMYSLNYKKRHGTKKKYHDNLLNDMLCLEENKEDNVEPTSEELEILEKEIFKKVEKNTVNIEKKVEVEKKVIIKKKEKEKEVEKEKEIEIYTYPTNHKYNITNLNYEPIGTQWIHDVQVDDPITSKEIKLSKQFDILRAIKLPEQRSPEWYEMRDGKITASDGGTVLDVNSHEQQYKFILKKTIGLPFISNVFVYHGKKLEEIAILIYEYRMNVKCEAFGLIGHPKYKFLGASPDSIAGKYKADGKHKSKFVGRMLEIKCPYVRKINMDGPIIDHICPIYYWVQVQLQLECCDLEECDFWQCELREYDSREEFIADTNPTEPFRSLETNFEKGCLIQLLPKDKMPDILNGKYDSVVWDDSLFIYPPKIEMTPYDCDLWISKTLNEMSYNYEYKNHFFDKVIYWKLVRSKNVVINRDRKWFAEKLPIFEKMWNYVLFFRKNKDKLDILLKYIDSRPVKKNKDIMNIVEKIYNVGDPNYNNIIQNILDDIEIIKMKKELAQEQKEDDDDDNYMFVNKTTQSKKPFVPNKYSFKKNIAEQKDNDDDDDGYMFVTKKPVTSKSPIEKPTSQKPIFQKKPTFQKKTIITTDDDDDYPFI